MIKTSLLSATMLAFFALPALAEGIVVNDAYARSSSMNAKAGAAFMVIENTTDTDDRLISATSDVAQRVELHTHQADSAGNMQMVEVKEGFAIPAHGSHALARGGDHVMFLGLNRGLAHGDMVDVTLTFEKAGDVTLKIPVDLERQDGPGMQMGGGMGQGQMHKHGASN